MDADERRSDCLYLRPSACLCGETSWAALTAAPLPSGLRQPRGNVLLCILCLAARQIRENLVKIWEAYALLRRAGSGFLAKAQRTQSAEGSDVPGIRSTGSRRAVR